MPLSARILALFRPTVLLGCTAASLLTMAATASGQILSGTVTKQGSVYVYSYTLNNNAAAPPISSFGILIDSFPAGEVPMPLSHTEPPAWLFSTSAPAGIADAPYFEKGVFWGWATQFGAEPGQSLTGFSFTSSLPPTVSPANNYFLYCRFHCFGFIPGPPGVQGIVEYGHVIAPDFRTGLAVEVPIDIKPRETPNVINPSAQGVVPVAIISTPLFIAPTIVDRASVTFGKAGTEDSLQSCTGVEDVNGDGLPDLVCHFRIPLTGLMPGDTRASLRARTVDGRQIKGVDSIQTKPR